MVTLTGYLSGFTGPITVAQGQFVLTSPTTPGAAAAYTANRNATLTFQNATFPMNLGSISAMSGGTVQYSNATITNAYLFGLGTHVLSASTTNSLNAVNIYPGAIVQQNGPAVFTAVTNEGLISINSGLTWVGGQNGIGGVLILSGTRNVSAWGNAGTITVVSGGLLNNGVSNLTSGGGGLITIDSGGTLNADMPAKACR